MNGQLQVGMMCAGGVALSVYWTIEWVPTQVEGQGVGGGLGDFLEVKAEWNPLFFSPFFNVFVCLFID